MKPALVESARIRVERKAVFIRPSEIGWKPVEFLAGISNSVGSVLKPAGLDNSKGVLSTK